MPTPAARPQETGGFAIHSGHLILLAITGASTVAGVYNEKLLKDEGKGIWYSNTLMYAYGVVVYLLMHAWSAPAGTLGVDGVPLTAVLYIADMVAMGLAVSFLLKIGSAVLKLFSSATSASCVVFAGILLGTPASMPVCVGGLFVYLALYRYVSAGAEDYVPSQYWVAWPALVLLVAAAMFTSPTMGA